MIHRKSQKEVTEVIERSAREESYKGAIKRNLFKESKRAFEKIRRKARERDP